jgi:hypothetical protein
MTMATAITRPGCMTQMSSMRPRKLVVMKRAPGFAAKASALSKSVPTAGLGNSQLLSVSVGSDQAVGSLVSIRLIESVESGGVERSA